MCLAPVACRGRELHSGPFACAPGKTLHPHLCARAPAQMWLSQRRCCTGLRCLLLGASWAMSPAGRASLCFRTVTQRKACKRQVPVRCSNQQPRCAASAHVCVQQPELPTQGLALSERGVRAPLQQSVHRPTAELNVLLLNTHAHLQPVLLSTTLQLRARPREG